MLAVGSAERQAKSRFGASIGTKGCRPRARSVLRCHGVLVLRQGLELVSRQFRKRRLALWAAGRGPDPSFAAMVFWCYDRILSPQLHDESQLQEDTGMLAVGSAERQAKSRFGAIGSSESDVWHCHYGLPAARPIRPSLPWCFGAATGSSHRSCAGRRPAARGHEHAGSWQCRKAGKVKVWS